MYDVTGLYQNLLDDLGDTGSLITSDLSLKEIHKVSIKRSICKKLVDAIDPLADERCLDKFVACNDACSSFRLSPRDLFHDQVINEVKILIDACFFEGPDLTLDRRKIFSGLGLGPGANLDCKSYDFYSKLFNSSLSRTSDRLYREYRCAIVDQPTWLNAEETRSAQAGDTLVVGSRLSFVPKQSDISRSICTEPTLNMLFQKGIGAHLEEELARKFRIDLSKQPDLNRELARIGSIDGSYGTIDLSCASDSISIELCRQILPPYVFRWLMLTRSPVTVLPDGTELKLEMISSMGNAFTFPLQTMIFASLVKAVYRTMGIPIVRPDGAKNFGVFGDDIIVVKDAYHFTVSCLSLFGFSVNESKSFNTGRFRESCGEDFYDGHLVRGVYLRSLSTLSDVYSAINRIVRWSERTGVILYKTVSGLRRRIPKHMFIGIPYHDSDDSGIKMPLARYLENTASFSQYMLDRRSPPKIKQHFRGMLRYKYDGSVPYLRMDSEVRSYPIPVDATGSTKLPGFQYNGSGIFLALVGGFIRNGRVSVRKKADRTNVRRYVTPSWEYRPAASRDERVDYWEIVYDIYFT